MASQSRWEGKKSFIEISVLQHLNIFLWYFCPWTLTCFTKDFFLGSPFYQGGILNKLNSWKVFVQVITVSFTQFHISAAWFLKIVGDYRFHLINLFWKSLSSTDLIKITPSKRRRASNNKCMPPFSLAALPREYVLGMGSNWATLGEKKKNRKTKSKQTKANNKKTPNN